MPRHLKKITLQEIAELWGFEPLIPLKKKNQQLYLIVKIDGTPHKQGGGSFIVESELKPDDLIHS